MTSTTRTDAMDNERAKSREIPVTLLALIPAAKSTSKRVTTGPGSALTTVDLTLNSCNFISSNAAIWRSCSDV